MIKISVIVPVYNVERHIRRCVKSILNQTYSNLEIILVDDGSTDESGTICNHFFDSRVIVLHQKNAGVSAARNAGIDCATGEYIGFVDADDYIEPQMYSSMLELITENTADIAICGYSVIDGYNSSNENSDFSALKQVFIYNSDEALNQMFCKRTVGGFLWNKLYNKRLFKKPYMIRLDESIDVFEDVLANLQCFQISNKIVYSQKRLYNYLMRDESAMHNICCKSNTAINACDKMLSLVQEKDIEIVQAFKAITLWTMVRRWEAAKNVAEYKKFAELFKVDRQYIFKRFDDFSLSEKVQVLVSCVSIRLTCIIANQIAKINSLCKSVT